MKILHLIDERWDSGVTYYALQIAELLKKDGHEVCVGALSGKKPEAMARARGLDTTPIDSVPALRRLIRAQAWDVINVHTGRSHSWALAFAPRGTPVVRTRGDARPVDANPLSRFVYRRTAGVIAASAHIGDTYEKEFGLNENRLHVVYPSVSVDETPSDGEPEVVGILGRLDPVKGHAVFLEAVASIAKERPQAKFLIAGKEANIGFSLLQNQMRELGIETFVEYLGYQSSAQQFMRRCSVGVIASIGSEEISRACLEWMSVGRPVVGTLVGCLPELIEPNETGLLVSAGDGLAMADAILKLLRDPALAKTWGRNAHELVKQKFGPEAQLRQTLDVYRRAADEVAHRAH